MVVPGTHKGPIFDHHGETAASAARSIRRAHGVDFAARCR